MTDAVRKVSAEAEQLHEHCELIDDLLGGTSKMRAAGLRRMPQWPGEDDAAYKVRLAVATLFPAYQRTIEVLGAKPFSKQLTYGDDVPPEIKAWCDNADRRKNNLDVFLSAVCDEALGYGFSGILVDYPQTRDAEGKSLYPTVAAEAEAGVRPYLVQIHPRNILGWEEDDAGLMELRLLECVKVPGERFTSRSIEQVRVLTRGGWEVWRKIEAGGKSTWELYDWGATTLNKIPFVPVNPTQPGTMVGKPPLLELAHANVEHWQTKNDRQTNLHMLSVPILFARMLDAAKIAVGAGSAVKAEHPEADMKYVEMSGVAVEAGRKVLLDLEDQMRQAGAELLIIKPGGTSVTQTIADNEQSACALQKIAQRIQDAANQALQLMAEWVRKPEGGRVTVYKDFGAATLAEASAELLFKSAAAGKISAESYFRELQRRGIIAPDLTWEEEVERIAAQGPALGTMTDPEAP